MKQKHITRRLFAVLLSVMMVITMMPAMAFADIGQDDVAKIDNTGYASLALAIEAANEGDEIELLSDVDISEVINIDKPITIDFGGYTLSSSAAVFNIRAASFGMKNATISAATYALYFAENAEVTAYGDNIITSGSGYSAIYSDGKLDVKGSDADEDSITVNATGAYSFELSGDSFSSRDIELIMNADRGIIIQEDHEKISVDISDSRVVGGNTIQRILQSWPYNGAVEFNIDNSIFEGYGAIVASADSYQKKSEDAIVNISNSEIELINNALNESETIMVTSNYGDATLTIDNSNLVLSQLSNEWGAVNVGTSNEKDNHGKATLNIENKSDIKINDGLYGLNAWTWGANNELGVQLIIADSKVDIVCEEGDYGIETYAYSKGALTSLKINNSIVDILSGNTGIKMGMSTEEYLDFNGDLSLEIINSDVSVDAKAFGIRMSTPKSKFIQTYNQSNSNVRLAGNEWYGLCLDGGSETGTTDAEGNVYISGGSIDVNDICIFSDKKASLTLDNTYAKIIAKNEKGASGECAEAGVSQLNIKGNSKCFLYKNGNEEPILNFGQGVITGGVFNISPSIGKYESFISYNGNYLVRIEANSKYRVVEDKDISCGTYTTRPENLLDVKKYQVITNESEDPDTYTVAPVPDEGKPLVINEMADAITEVSEGIKDNEKVKGTEVCSEADLTDEALELEEVKGTIENADGEKTIRIEPYLESTITDYTENGSDKTLTVDIEAKCKITVGGEEKEEKPIITVTEPVDLSISLPDGFAGDAKTLYVKHVKQDGRTYFYEGTVKAGILEFTNPHGFSEFTITKKNQSVATINNVGYITLQDAIDAAKSGDKIIIRDKVPDKAVVIHEEKTFMITWGSYESCTISTDVLGYEVKEEKVDDKDGTKYILQKKSKLSKKAVIAIVGGVAAVGVTAGVITAAVKNAKKTYTVSFDTQGIGAPIESVAVKKKGTLTPPATPMAEGYRFRGWYKEAECITPWGFENDKVTENTILYADWQALTPVPSPVLQPDNVPVLMLQAKVSGDKAIKLNWNEVEGAEKYVVYGAQCGKKLKKLTTTSNLNYTVKKISGKKLVAHKSYEMYVVAYVGGEKLQSDSIHFITANTMNKYANTTSVKVAKAAKMLKAGKTYKISATAKIYKNKKHLTSSKHGAKFRYTSNCPEVATVDEKGVVTAVAPGEATIYVQDTCGPVKEVVITVYENVSVDGVHYVLGDDWTYDEETRSFQNINNDNAYYTIGDQWGDEICSSIDERIATFAPDGSDGFELYETTVYGTRALLVVEPVNEIKDYNLFFYANGVEHRINYETDFYYDDIQGYTAELIEGICW